MMPARCWAPLLGSWKRAPSPRTKEGECFPLVPTQKSSSVTYKSPWGTRRSGFWRTVCERGRPELSGQLHCMMSRSSAFVLTCAWFCFRVMLGMVAQLASAVVSRVLGSMSPLPFTLFTRLLACTSLNTAFSKLCSPKVCHKAAGRLGLLCHGRNELGPRRAGSRLLQAQQRAAEADERTEYPQTGQCALVTFRVSLVRSLWDLSSCEETWMTLIRKM